jgi:FtsP/CotA-like multicopper oxidase with cupredoxin domain
MTVNFPARRPGVHFEGGPARTASAPRLSRRSVLKLGLGSTALAAAGAYGLDRAVGGRGLYRIADNLPARPVKLLSLMGTDGWISMPSGKITNPALAKVDPALLFADGAAPGGPTWPDPFAAADRNLYIFGFASGGRFDTPNRLEWANVYNGNDPRSAAVGGLAALKSRANLAAPILYYHEGDDIRITLWTGGMGNRPDIVDPHTIHWHGFPNQIPYFDGVPNDSLAVPIGANLVYRYLPYHGMAGSYMWHCHVSDAEHVQMGLQSIVFIRPYQNYGVPTSSQYNTNGIEVPLSRAGAIDLINAGQSGLSVPAVGPMGYAFNDGVGFDPDPAHRGTTYYPAGSTAYDREFAFILDELDARIHYDDAHFLAQDFSEWAPKFNIMNGRAWPDTIAGNWDVTQLDWTDPARSAFHYNIATVDQVLLNPTESNASKWKVDPTAYLTADHRLGSQPWSSLIQANAGETILLRFANLGYNEHDMELAGLQFTVIGQDAKNLLQGRDGYEENPNPNDASFSPMTAHRSDISFKTYRTALGPAESRDLLVQIPKDAYNTNGKPVVFEFFDRNDALLRNNTLGGPVAGGIRTQLHVYPPNTLPRQNYPQQVFNGGIYS